MLRWDQSEFLLKGVFLGLLVQVAWLSPSWDELAWLGAIVGVALALCLTIAAVRKLRDGYQVRGRVIGFILFLLLDHPTLVYTGLVGGLALGVVFTFRGREGGLGWDAYVPVAAGAALGMVLYALRHVRDRKTRVWLGLALAAALSAGAAAAVHFQPTLLSAAQETKLACVLLLGIPGFYLLTFAGLAEESEAEIAAMCAALGVSLWLLVHTSAAALSSLALAVPLALYYVYTRYVLPDLRVLKHALRGLGYKQVGNTRAALVSLSRALQLDPQNALAREQLWEIHRELDVATLKEQPEILALIDYGMCLDRVRWLMLQERPSAGQLAEGRHLLELVADQRPNFAPACAYWRAVAATHERRLDEAARELETILRLPQQDTAARRSIHFAAWQLALLLHPELRRRVGEPLLTEPGERMDAISAVERRLAQTPDDPAARDLQRLLYSEMTEGEYVAAVPSGQAADFNHELAQQLGLALLEDPGRWQRGCEYLRLAARGLPLQAPGIYLQIAQACEKAGDLEAMWTNSRRAMVAGRAAGAALQALPAEDQKALFTAVKKVGERAVAENQNDVALEAFKFYSQYEGAGKLETYRTLAELFERRARPQDPASKAYRDDLWMALSCAEHALSYNSTDPDLLARKDRYYISITPDDLKERLEQVRGWFDVEYCLTKTRWLLKNYKGDLDLLDWASHLADLAQTMLPGSIAARYLRALIRRERGEIPEALELLENIRQNRPEKFANQEEADAWYFAHRLLGDLYLESKPDQAVLCYQEFRTSDHSGADTLFKLGRAHEALGDHARAARMYEAVTGYEQHPLYYEARDALERVRALLSANRG
jgi:hypothetical protein